MIKLFGNYIKIDTPNTTLLLLSYDKKVFKIYYGDKICDDTDYLPLFNYIDLDQYASIDDTYYYNTISSCTGDGNNIESMVRIVGERDNFVSRFELLSVNKVDINEGYTMIPHSLNKTETIELKYLDIINNVTLVQYISTFDDSNVLAFQTKVINTSEKNIHVNRLMSLQMDFEASHAYMYTLDGAWCRERNISKHLVENSIFTIESRSGFSSNLHNPFVIIEIPKQGYYASNLIYSGNHKEILESVPIGKCRYLSGMNDYMMRYELKPNDELKSVEALMVYADNLDKITLEMHKFARKHVLRPDFQDVLRPVLLNNWEATYFDFNYDKLIELAKRAKETGIELFVLDDGWFGKRNSDNCSLGDWHDNVAKTGGLHNLSREIKKLGMKFGLWFEPEMISFDSELFKTHPEYMMRFPDEMPMEKRNQQMLDLVNPEVVDYLISTLSNVLSDVKPDYVKWDCNRNMIDIYSSTLENHGEYFHKYILGLYRLCHTLVTRFPNILFEACSAGGNRFDLGMMYFMPQTWASDNSESNCRLLIQEGTLYAYPQNSVGSHVSICPNHQTLFSTSLESRFNVASIGAFGYEMDLESLTDDEINTVKNQIDFYKKHKKLLQLGNYYRLGDLTNENTGGWIIVDDNKEEAIATIVIKKLIFNNVRPKFMFKGLDPMTKYHVLMRAQDNIKKIIEFEAYGDILMKYGIDFGDLFFTETDRSTYGNTFASRMILFKKLN